MIIDLHVHTQEVSACGHVAVEEIIDRYNAKGYDAIVITNHLNDWTVGIKDSEDNWEGFVDSYYAPVKKGREYAARYGMKVFFGCELRFVDDANDYLVYGMTEEFLKTHPDIRTVGIEKLFELANQNGFLVYQAHPFRNGMKITPVKYLHGIEVSNGHPRQESRNDFARLWADVHSLRMVSGSDFHQQGDEARGGIISFRDIKCEKELCELLLSEDYKLIADQTGGFLRK